MKRLLKIVIFGVFSILLTIGGGAALWVWSTLPSIDAVIEVPLLESPVEVMRDQFGIPHIFAKSSRDAYFALGFVHAQDRFWQMEMMRRLGAGRLAEVLGVKALASDKWMRVLGLYRLAEKQYAALPDPVRIALDVYAAGVNARIERTKNLPWGVPSPEFALLRYSPEPWRPADSLVWGKIMAARLGGNWRDEILRVRLARKLAPQRVGELWPLYPSDAPATIEKAERLTRGLDLGRLAAAAPEPAGLPRGASNAWVVGGRLSTTRQPLLANDPHLGFSAPVVWYLARLKAPDLDVTGATVPGVPFTILGHNGRIAWGMTNTQTDIQDLFVEKIDASGRYLTPNGWKEFETRTETITVKGAKPVTLKIRSSRHGPIVSDVGAGIAKAAGKGTAVALSATFLEPDDGTVEAFYHLNRAENWKTFTDALKGFQAPQSNFFFADTQNNIGFLAPGLVPIRKRGWGLVPSPGWDGKTDWNGYVPFSQLPSVLNPPQGLIVNANNRITPEGYPHFITYDWAPGYRARRILDLLDGKPQSVHAAIQIQRDHVSEMARHLLPLMLDIEPASERGRRVVALLGKWDGKMSRKRPEPLIFSTWLLELNRAIYADELGDLFRDFLTLRPRFIVSVLTRRRAWCDDVGTPDKKEDCQDRLLLSLQRALESLESSMGKDFKDWRWGEVHRARFRHWALGAVEWLRPIVELDISTDGGNYTVNRGATLVNHPERPFQHIHGAGYRAVYDLKNLRRSRFMIATGQSGHPASPHYRDLLTDWRDGRTLRMGQTHAELKNSAAAILVLTPTARDR